MLHIRAQKTMGYQEIVGTENEHLKLLNFGLLNLQPNETYVANTGAQEQVLILLQGSFQVEVAARIFSGQRKGVFEERATAVYLPIESTFKVTNTGNQELQAALCGTPSPTQYEPFMVQPNEVWARAVGQDNWHREVHDIVVKNAEGRVHRIIVGETFNDPGNWSSYPPHKHDHFEQGVEANMEEVYYYRLNPAQGFGVQSIYTHDGSRNEAYRVQDGDTFLVPGGYHPVCAGGGYRLYYLWMMAGETDRVMIPHDDPNHQWLKG